MQGECDEPPEGPLLAEVAEAQLQPRQCLIVVDSMFVEARSGAAVAVAVDNLYLRMRQFSPVWPEDGLVSSNGASVWLSNMTFQGQINSGPALNPFNQSRIYVSGALPTRCSYPPGASTHRVPVPTRCSYPPGDSTHRVPVPTRC